MHPMLVVAIPLGLIFVGMVLNNFGLSFDQPPSSAEQDPVKRVEIERETFRKFFDRQRRTALERQKRVGQYAWLLLLVTSGAFIWLYINTVDKTTLANRIATLQTLGSQEGKDLILSVTASDGANVKYLIKLPPAEKKTDEKKEPVSKETVSTWEIEKLETALSIGDVAMPLGIALKVSK